MLLEEITGEETQELQNPGYADTADVKAHVFPALQAKIEKLNRKAKRIGAPPIELKIEKEFYVDEEPEDNHESDYEPEKVKTKWYKVRVTGEAPQVAGYQFVATIQHKDGGNIIRTAPGQEGNENIKAFYEARPDYCDHCHKKRHRIDTFIVKGQDGKLRQVGRNCLADFIGGQDPKQILWYFSLRDLVGRAMKEASEETSRHGRREQGATPQSVLSVAAAIIRQLGYVKASEADEGRTPTSRIVRFVIFGNHRPPLSRPERQWLDAAKSKTPADEELTKKAIEWFESIPQEEKDRSEFYHNIQVLLKSEVVSPRDVGYVSAIFPSYARAMNMQRDRSQEKNEHAGAVGQKLPPTPVTVVSTTNINGQYGVTQLCRMHDAEGRLYVWFNSGGNRLEQGQKLTITGTIKKHDEFKGRKQTVLTRVKDMAPSTNQPANPVKKPEPQQPAPEMKWDLGSSKE
jgi:hypothetical protein